MLVRRERLLISSGVKTGEGSIPLPLAHIYSMLTFRTWLEEWEGTFRINQDVLDLFPGAPRGFNVWKNPSREEVIEAVEEDDAFQKLVREPKSKWTANARGIIDSNGNVFVWAENFGQHDFVAKHLNVRVAARFYLETPQLIFLSFESERTNQKKLMRMYPNFARIFGVESKAA